MLNTISVFKNNKVNLFFHAIDNAIKTENLYEINEVIDSGISINGFSEICIFGYRNKYSPLGYAIARGASQEIIALLLEHNADLSICRKNLGDNFGCINALDLIVWCYRDKVRNKKILIKYLLDHGANFFNKKHKAIFEGNLNKLQELEEGDIKNGNELNVKMVRRYTPLMFAVLLGELEVVKWFFKKTEVNLNEKDEDGNTVFLLAVASGQLEIAKWFLEEKKGGIDEKNEYGYTPLLLAAAGGHLEMVKWLSKKCNINETDKYGYTALLLAAAGGHLEVLKWLLLKKSEGGGGANIEEKDMFNKTSFLLAAAGGHLEVVKWLLKTGRAKITEKSIGGTTALLFATLNEHLETVKWLVEEGGADVDDKDCYGKSAISLLKNSYMHKIAVYLTDSLSAYFKYGNNYLLSNLNTMDKYYQLELLDLLISKYPARVKEILEKIDPKCFYDYCNNNCLHLAIKKNYPRLLEIFIQQNKNLIEQVNKNGLLPIHIAATNNNVDCLKIIVTYCGIEILNKQDSQGRNAMHYAAIYGNINIIDYLIDYLDINTKDMEDKSPLDYIVSNGDVRTFVHLLCNPKILLDNRAYFIEALKKINITKLYLNNNNLNLLSDNDLLNLFITLKEVNINFLSLSENGFDNEEKIIRLANILKHTKNDKLKIELDELNNKNLLKNLSIVALKDTLPVICLKLNNLQINDDYAINVLIPFLTNCIGITKIENLVLDSNLLTNEGFCKLLQLFQTNNKGDPQTLSISNNYIEILSDNLINNAKYSNITINFSANNIADRSCSHSLDESIIKITKIPSIFFKDKMLISNKGFVYLIVDHMEKGMYVTYEWMVNYNQRLIKIANITTNDKYSVFSSFINVNPNSYNKVNICFEKNRVIELINNCTNNQMDTSKYDLIGFKVSKDKLQLMHEQIIYDIENRMGSRYKNYLEYIIFLFNDKLNIKLDNTKHKKLDKSIANQLMITPSLYFNSSYNVSIANKEKPIFSKQDTFNNSKLNNNNEKLSNIDYSADTNSKHYCEIF